MDTDQRNLLYSKLFRSFIRDRGIPITAGKWSEKDAKAWGALVRIFNKKHPVT